MLERVLDLFWKPLSIRSHLNKSRGDQQRGSALALGIIYHAQRRACLSVVTRLALLGQLVTFISGWGVYFTDELFLCVCSCRRYIVRTFLLAQWVKTGPESDSFTKMDSWSRGLTDNPKASLWKAVAMIGWWWTGVQQKDLLVKISAGAGDFTQFIGRGEEEGTQGTQTGDFYSVHTPSDGWGLRLGSWSR